MGQRDSDQRNISKDRRTASERVPGRPKTAHVQDPTKATPKPASQPPKRRKKSSEPLSVPWWGFLLVIVLVGGITCGLWGYVLSIRGDNPASSALGPTPTGIIVIITPTSTLDTGPGSSMTAVTPQQQPTTVPSQGEATATIPPENREITVGGNVTINGTGGEGLSIRQGPGLNYGIFEVGEEGEVFVVEDGPREADGFTWWYIVDPTDENRAGWAVQIYLSAGP